MTSADANSNLAACIEGLDPLVVDLDKLRSSDESEEDFARALHAASLSQARAVYIHESLAANIPDGDRVWYSNVAPVCAAIAKVAPAECTRLVIDTYFQTMTRQASVYCGDLGAMFNALPALEQVYIAGYGTAESLALPSMRELRWMGEELSALTVAAVLAADAPNLELLALGMAYEQGTEKDVVKALVAGLKAARFPQLRELHLAFGFVDDLHKLIGQLAKSPLLKQLDVLVLDASSNSEADELAAAFTKHAKAFSHLSRFGVCESVIDDFMDGEEEAIRDALPGFEVLEYHDSSFSPTAHDWLRYEG